MENLSAAFGDETGEIVLSLDCNVTSDKLSGESGVSDRWSEMFIKVILATNSVMHSYITFEN